jgi:HTH-type transcriptional regulator/antitoxin HigA
VLLHPKKGIFIDEGKGTSSFEVEADAFAARTLIPSHEFDAFAASKPLSRNRVIAFAHDLGVAPGIVVGRLQHEKRIPYSHLNELKRRFSWSTPPAES